MPGGDGPAPRLPKEPESGLAPHPVHQPRYAEERPSAAKDFCFIVTGVGVPLDGAIKPWTLSWGNNSNSIILTGAKAERRNCWRRLGKQEPHGSGGRSWYWLFSLTSVQTWPWDVACRHSSSPVSVQFFQGLSQKEGRDILLKSWECNRSISGRKF